MRNAQIIFVLSAALLAIAPACAAEIGIPGSRDSDSVSLEPPRMALLGNQDPTNGARYQAAGSGSYEVVTPSQSRDGAETKNERAKFASAGGFHWTADGDRPTLAYRFSESGAVRLRGNLREPRIVFSWKF